MGTSNDDNFWEDWIEHDSILKDINEVEKRCNSQKPNLNTTSDSVVSLRGAMLLTAHKEKDSPNENESVPHNSSNHSENEFKIPNTQALKKKSNTSLPNNSSPSHPKAKRLRNLNETTNGGQLLFQSASKLYDNDKIIKDNILVMEKELLGESLSEQRRNHDISILDKHNTTLMCELNGLFGNNLKNAVEQDFSRIEDTIHSIPEYIPIPEKGNASAFNESSYNFNLTNDTFAKTIKNNNNCPNNTLRTNGISSQSFDSAFNNLPSTLTLNGFKNMGPFYGLPLKVKELLASAKGIDELYDWQDECLNLPALKQRKNLIYALPTSGGKTLVAEILLFQEIVCRNKNVLFILPYVSIVQEKIWALAPFQIALDFLVEEYAGSKGKYPPRQRRNKRCVYVATIEKASNLIYSLYENGRIKELGLIIVDEIHLLGESRRGCVLETLLSIVLYLKENIQIIGMSATIGNLNDLCQFLNAEVYTRNFRPVELTEYFKCNNKIFKIEYNAEKMVQFARNMENSSEIANKLDPDHIGILVQEIIYETSCLIFCPTKKNCENVAVLLTEVLNKNILDLHQKERHQLCSIMQNDGRLCPILKKTLPYGIAYHHSGLTSEERVLIEDAFRSGVINVICCTSTLAAGVNLPAQRVILRSPYVGSEFISLSKYKQMIGRAGRAGFGEMGESYLICARKDITRLQKLLESSMEHALSTLHENNNLGLKNFFLSVIGLGIAKNRKEINELMKYTLLSVQKDKLNLNIKQVVDSSIKSLLEQQVVYGLPNQPEMTPSDSKVVLTCDEELGVTRQGKAAIKSGLQVTKAQMIFADLIIAQRSLVLLNSLHLLYLVTPYDLAESIRPERDIYYGAYNSLDKDEVVAARVIGITEYSAIRIMRGQPLRDLPERVYKRFYLTLMLLELWKEVPIFLVAEKFKVNRGFLQQLMTSSASFASNLFHFCENLEEFRCFCALLDDLSSRLVHCCTPELLPLLELPHVKKSRAKQLLQAGFNNLQTIATTQPLTLVKAIPNLSTKVAIQMINTAKLILLQKVENLREDAQDLLELNVEDQIS